MPPGAGGGPPPGMGGPPPAAMPGVPPSPQGLPVPGGEPFDPQAQMKGIASMGADLDRGILVLAQALPQGSQEFAMARQLIQAGLAKAFSQQAEAPSASPTAIGNQFPGGGMAL